VEFRKGSTWSYLLIRCPKMHNKHSFRYYCCHFRQYERGFKEIMKKTKHQRSADYILGAKSLFVTIRMLCTVSFGTILPMFMTPHYHWTKRILEEMVNFQKVNLPNMSTFWSFLFELLFFGIVGVLYCSSIHDTTDPPQKSCKSFILLKVTKFHGHVHENIQYNPNIETFPRMT
jgi:hypothetical protein